MLDFPTKPLFPTHVLPGNFPYLLKSKQERTPEIKAYGMKQVKVSALRHCGASAADKTKNSVTLYRGKKQNCAESQVKSPLRQI